MPEILTDIFIHLPSGKALIDPDTGDAVLISGVDVILQDLAIKLKTQVGTVKRQGVDGFGWDYWNRIKGDVDVDFVTTVSNKLTSVAMEDDRIQDAQVRIEEQPTEDSLTFQINVKIAGEWFSLPFATPL